MLPFFGASVYDDPKVYAKSSPIEFIKNVEDADARPARRPRLRGPDAAGLRVLARAEGARRRRRSSSSTPDEGHGIRRAEHQLRHPRSADRRRWFDKYLTAVRRSRPSQALLRSARSSPAARSSSPAAARASASRWRRPSPRTARRSRSPDAGASGSRRPRARSRRRRARAARPAHLPGRRPRARRRPRRCRARRRALRQGRRPRQQRRRQLPRVLRGAHAERLRRRRAHGPLRLRQLHARRRPAPARAQGARAPIVSIVDDLRLDRHGLRAALGLRQGGRPRDDALARGRVGRTPASA